MNIRKGIIFVSGILTMGFCFSANGVSWGHPLPGAAAIASGAQSPSGDSGRSPGPISLGSFRDSGGTPILLAESSPASDPGGSSGGQDASSDKKKKEKKTQKGTNEEAPSAPFPVGQAPKPKKKPPQIETIVSATGILIPKGTILIQDTVSYVHNTASQLALQGFTVIPAILIGSINVESVSQDIYTNTVTVYYGITDKLEFEADIPYVYRTENVLTRSIATGSSSPISTDTQGADLGDIQFGFHYQFNTAPEGGFFFLGNLLVKSTTGSNPFTTPVDSNGILTNQPTGTGFWSVEPGLTILFPDDPVTFYGNASYIYNFSTNFGGNLGVINPGNITDFNLGAGFSLNEKASFSIGYDQMTLWPPSQNGEIIPLTHVLQMGSLLFGYSYNVSRFFFYMLNVEAGVTPDAPNVQISIRVPLYF
jgi:hypothetical protein